MPLTKIKIENFTIFEDITIPFSKGLNILVGENGMGKTHVMKLAYAACQSRKHDVSFSQKTMMLFRPDQSSIRRLVNRNKNGENTAKILVESDIAQIGMSFSTKTKKWDAEVKLEEKWEKQMSGMTSIFLKPGTQAKLEFNLVAEGIRKIALLWQLIKNGTLEKGSVLFWDEPEANINPKYIPVLAELLIMLEKEGVQIFVSTHDYFLSKYIEVKREKDNDVQYISVYKDEKNLVQCEIAKEFELLEHNTIMDTFRQLYREEIGR